ncbi:DUF3572 domain-containing protein [Parerythrobacter jejuensis]|uniref:DUF3572 family protein n=1 Tax=Parerythrobacter jejuensis TaxID=795812 RepID=A0A845APB7_9SPHN|nr:DUF3572 domain-containing protein [Parerythrobacter jejuensis]MXP30745.1 DUF3572 family protein [Parerythrobacter jejuensis]MXP33505.1 DUF3572 family protein [Parerythrobacter jejuensis]
MPIIRSPQSPEHQSSDPDALALGALGWVLTDDSRAERLLSLTGLTPDILRERLTDRTVLAAVLDFLANHEPDLLLAADALEVEPQALLSAREHLTR